MKLLKQKKEILNSGKIVVGYHQGSPIAELLRHFETATSYCVYKNVKICENYDLGNGVIVSCGIRPINNAYFDCWLANELNREIATLINKVTKGKRLDVKREIAALINSEIKNRYLASGKKPYFKA